MIDRLVLVAMVTFAATGCTAMVFERVKHAAMPVIECLPENLSVEMHDIPNASIGKEWTAQGCGREADCRYEGQVMVCHETPNSKKVRADADSKKEAENNELAVKDRLSMETGCDEANVKVVKRAAWSKGGEQSFRLEACGKPYVCSAGRGGLNCKEALGGTPDAG